MEIIKRIQMRASVTQRSEIDVSLSAHCMDKECWNRVHMKKVSIQDSITIALDQNDVGD